MPPSLLVSKQQTANSKQPVSSTLTELFAVSCLFAPPRLLNLEGPVAQLRRRQHGRVKG